MDTLLAVDWLALLAFAAGTLLGLGAGWLLRGWREDDARERAAGADADTAGLQVREPATRTATPPTQTWKPAASAPSLEPIELDEGAVGPTVLLIDDRLEMLGIHAAYLRKHGYRTLMAENGTTGLQFARAYRPTMIVLDHSMPDRTGIEVARELKADPTTAHIPILLMTALSYGAVGTAAIEAGCAAFLPKPIEPSRLLREIVAHTPKH